MDILVINIYTHTYSASFICSKSFLYIVCLKFDTTLSPLLNIRMFSQLYIVKVTWSDGQRYEVFRSYGEFFTLRNTLLQQFPEQELKSARNTIPPLSSKMKEMCC